MWKPGASLTAQDTAARREEGGEVGEVDEGSFFSSSRIQLKDFVLLDFCSMHSLFFSIQGKNNDNWCHLDRQTDGVRCTGTKTETVIHGVLYPRAPQWNQVVSLWKLPSQTEIGSHSQAKTYSLSF